MIQRSLRHTLIAFAACAPLLLHAETYTASTVNEVSIPWHDGCWLLVDLDNCLFEAKQALGHANWFYDLVTERMQKGMSKKEAVLDAYPLWVKVQKRCEVQPIEEDFVSLIKKLQRLGITVMGLTHRQPPVAASTARQVRSLGVDFTKTAPASEVPVCFDVNGPAVYRDGILFVGDYNNKSDLLSAFLEHFNVSPDHVIFFDDKKKNVVELEPMLSQRGIEYSGVHYTAIEDKPAVYDPNLARLQLHYFDRILSNSQVTQLTDEASNDH